MWIYSLVEEIIMNQDWIQNNGDYWRAGRIECYESDGSGYSNIEYSLIIHSNQWVDFRDYLDNIVTDNLQNLDELIINSSVPIIRFNHE
jgi:hypothetical protein